MIISRLTKLSEKVKKPLWESYLIMKENKEESIFERKWKSYKLFDVIFLMCKSNFCWCENEILSIDVKWTSDNTKCNFNVAIKC